MTETDRHAQTRRRARAVGLTLAFLILVAGALFLSASGQRGTRNSPATKDGASITHPVPESLKTAAEFEGQSAYLGEYVQSNGIYPDPVDKGTYWILGDGGLIQYRPSNATIERELTEADGVSQATSVARVGDLLYIERSDIGKLQALDLESGSRQQWGLEDGLVNGSNLALYRDPFDDRTLWIGTFDGISLFDLEAQEFSASYRTELLSGASQWSVFELAFSSDAVWANVTAHAHSPGGIARFDRSSRTWKTWGPEAFGQTDRVDLADLGVVGTTPIVGFSARPDAAFAYRHTTETWQPMPALGRLPEASLSLAATDRAIAIGVEGYDNSSHDGLYRYNLSTDELTKLDKRVPNYGLSYDPVSGRIIDYPAGDEVWSFDTIDLDTGTRTRVAFPMDRIRGAIHAYPVLDKYALFLDADTIHALNLTSGDLSNLEAKFGLDCGERSDDASSCGVLATDTAVFVYGAAFGSFDGCTYDVSALALDPTTLKVLHSFHDAEPSCSITLYRDGDEILVVEDAETQTVKSRFTATHGNQPSSGPLPTSAVPLIPQESTGEGLKASNDRYSVETGREVGGTAEEPTVILRVTDTQTGQQSEVQVPLVQSAEYTPFDWSVPVTSIHRLRFDSLTSSLLWIATSSCLGLADLATGEVTCLTPDNSSLVVNFVQDVWPSPQFLIVEHEWGTAIYPRQAND